MAVLNIYDLTGTQTGTVEVKDTVFGIEPNQAVLHEVLTAELAAARQGTAATKTRAMVTTQFPSPTLTQHLTVTLSAE